MEALVATVVLVAVLVAWHLSFGGRLPPALRDRICQGRAWRRAFPGASRSDIRAFLSLVVEAFAFSGRERLKLAPGDEILGIYRAIYPKPGWGVDGLELESLALAVERKRGVGFRDLWHEKLTLGELFSKLHPAGRLAPGQESRWLVQNAIHHRETSQ